MRIALSLTVDRVALNELVYDGLYTPRPYSPISAMPQHYPKLSNAYLGDDPDQANALLDGTGYSEKDSEGFQVWPGTNFVSLVLRIAKHSYSVTDEPFPGTVPDA